MARYGQRPENALKRANEFIEVGKPARALDTLYEVFRNKKWACNWSETVLEPIMFKYLDLCVELKKSHIAKEGLFQYRNMFQSVNVGSLENVIRGYLRTAEERTEAAREQSQQAVIDVEDLEMIATPESILLSAVSGEDAQDRSDRTILTPWVKFLWESYCQCLELLRTNAHVETLYHDIARMAFSFCLKYSRKTEFRKLCDKLRKHLEDIAKLPAQVSNVSISKPETQQLNLETRLVQLDSAIHMELWQEAYKATEDIHGLMNMSKKSPVPKTMANYYQKLALVFWKANNNLFHAAALFKLFQLSKEMKKNMTPEELQRMACRVLLATLAIPLPSAHPEFDRFIETDKSPLEKAQRLATLLGLGQPPSRASLLKDIVRLNVVSLAAPQLQDLYSWLEVEFDPLNLCTRVQGVVEALQAEENSQLVQYIPALQDVTLVRLIRQVSQVYQTIKIARLLELARFTDKMHMERLLVDCVRHNDMQIRIDHGAECIHFGMDLAESQREDHPEGPTLQSMPSEQVRNQLINMACVLTKAMNTINPVKKKMERDVMRHKMVKHYHETKMRDHAAILQRHKIIEDRKEYIERLNTIREEEAARRQDELQRLQMQQEQKRLAQEMEERERKRQANEIQQIKDRHLKEKMQQISQTAHGQKILKKLDEDEIKNLDAEQITAKEMEELQKERKEMMQKLKSQEKKMDYFERAKRIEEIPLLQKALEENQIKDRQFWEQQEKERIQKLVEEREIAVQHRERLKRMYEDKEEFLAQLKSERSSAYQEKMKAFLELLDSERKKRLEERRSKRKQERQEKYYRQKREEEERREREEREERERREKEEREERERKEKEEKEERERLEREAREEEERKRKEALDRQARIQQERLEEIERRALAEKTATGPSSSWRSRADDGPRDRDRDRDREVPRERERERERDAPRGEESSSSWRRSTAAEPSKEAWKPTRLREGDWRSRGADRSETDRDREVESSRFERDREAPRGFERGDRDRFDRGDRERDRDGPRGFERGERDRDREGPRGFDRDRGFERGGDRGGFDRERDGGRGGFPARGDRGTDGGSWRRAPGPEEEDDKRGPPRREDRRDDRRDERRDDRRDDRRDIRRDDVRGPPKDGGSSWRKEAPATPAPAPAPAAAPVPAPAPKREDAPPPERKSNDGEEDDGWSKVGRR